MIKAPLSSRGDNTNKGNTRRSKGYLDKHARLTQEAAEEDLAHCRVLQKRGNDLVVMVERGRLSNKGHEAVRARQLKNFFDLRIRQALRQQPERQLRPEFRTHSTALLPLVLAQRLLAELILQQGLRQNFGRNGGAQDAVIDSTAGRGLDKTGRIADDEQAVGIGLPYRRERKDARAWRDSAVCLKAPPRRRSEAPHLRGELPASRLELN